MPSNRSAGVSPRQPPSGVHPVAEAGGVFGRDLATATDLSIVTDLRRKLDGRDFGEADLLRSLQPRVPGHDAILAIDQNRVCEAKSLDAAGD
jgi:hypothetical protein